MDGDVYGVCSRHGQQVSHYTGASLIYVADDDDDDAQCQGPGRASVCVCMEEVWL